jgi:hypothetical protein
MQLPPTQMFPAGQVSSNLLENGTHWSVAVPPGKQAATPLYNSGIQVPSPGLSIEQRSSMIVIGSPPSGPEIKQSGS